MEINNDSIKNVLEGMFDSIGQENMELYKKLSDTLPKVKIESCDGFYYSLMCPHENFISGLIEVEVSKNPHMKFMLMNSLFIENHFEKIIERVEGRPCSADKSRTILSGIFHFFKDDTKINWNYEQEYTFHLPKKVFTTHEDIMEFYAAIKNLYYGNFEKYVAVLHKILLIQINNKP